MTLELSHLHVTDPESYFALRNDPPSELIDDLSGRFVMDSELDRMLVRKMKRRSGDPYQRITLDAFVGCLDSMLGEVLPGDYEIADAHWFAGGASKIQLGFALSWNDPERGPVTDHLVVRMDPSEGLNATSRRQEVEMLRAVRGSVPVPRVLWLDEDARWFPEPALVYELVPGVTKPTATETGAVSGLGTVFGAALRPALGAQFLTHLAKLHTLDVDVLDLPTFDRPMPGTDQAAAWKVNQFRRIWHEDRAEDSPLMDAAASWLRHNLPVADRISVIHGDFRSGNFLFDEERQEITAWLDWEYCHLGDRHRDLAWVTDATFGHVDPGTGDYLVSGLFTEAEFLDRYQELSGLTVDPQRLAFYKISNTFQLLVATLATAPRIAGLGKTHQDVLLAWVKGMVPVLSNQLIGLLEKEL